MGEVMGDGVGDAGGEGASTSSRVLFPLQPPSPSRSLLPSHPPPLPPPLPPSFSPPPPPSPTPRIKAEAGLDEEALEASVDFDTFARLMSHSDNALADLDLFDSRMPTSPGDVGVRGGTLFAPGGALASVLEAAEANEA